MQQPEGRVLSVDASVEPAKCVIEVATNFRCTRCAAGKGCGAGLLAGDAESRRVDAHVASPLALQAGDRVQLELTADNLLRAAVLVYGVPLAGALVGAANAWWFGAGDAVAVLSAIAGATAGAAIVRFRLRRESCLQQCTPLVTARLDTG